MHVLLVFIGKFTQPFEHIFKIAQLTLLKQVSSTFALKFE